MTNQEKLTIQLLNKITESEKDIKAQWSNPIGTSTRHFVVDNVLDSQTCKNIYRTLVKTISIIIL